MRRLFEGCSRSIDFTPPNRQLFPSDYANSIMELTAFPINEKVPGLVNILKDHHSATLIHSFETTLVALKLAKQYDVDAASIRTIFLGALFHDIGKIGVRKDLLDRKRKLTEEERQELYSHGLVGSLIMRDIGLEEISCFCREHHIGNTRNYNHPKDLSKRHPLTEFITLADLITATLDSRRPYNKHAHDVKRLSKEEIIKRGRKLIEKKKKAGVFSQQLVRVLYNLIDSNDIFPPPYKSKDDFDDSDFQSLIDHFGLRDIFNAIDFSEGLPQN